MKVWQAGFMIMVLACWGGALNPKHYGKMMACNVDVGQADASPARITAWAAT